MLKKISEKTAAARDRYGAYIDRQITKGIRRVAKRTLERKGGIQNNVDYLLAGKAKEFGEAEFGEIAPWMFYEVPADMRVLPVWDGRLPNGDDPTLLGYRHVTAADITAMVREAFSKSWKSAKFIVAGISSLAVAASIYKSGMDMPSWSVSEWIWELPLAMQFHAVTASAIVWVVDFISRIIGTVINSGSSLLIGLAFTVAAGVLAIPLGMISSLNKTWLRYKHALTHHLSLPTREGMYLWKNTGVDREKVMEAYAKATYDAIGRLKDLPFIKLGTATGIFADRGYRGASQGGSVIGWDGESLRQHMICFGETGSGKTRLFLIPVFRQVFEADWKGHKMGAVIFDGKGELPFVLRNALPPHRKKDFILIGTEDGAFGIDLLASMSPVEVSDAFLMIATQMAGPDNSGGKWILGAANAIKHAAFMAEFLEKDARGDIWRGRPYKPYSLLGLLALTTEPSLYEAISKKIIDGFDNQQAVYPDELVGAARFFQETWKTYAPETRSSYQSNITDTLDQLSGTKELATKFASGKIDGVNFVDLDEAFDGKIIGIGISGTEDSKPGLIIANWIKSRLYVLAQRRITKAAKAAEILTRVEECKAVFDKLNARSLELTKLRNLLDREVDRGIQAFKALFPSEKGTLDTADMKNLTIIELRDISMGLRQFTREVRDLSIAAPSPEFLASCPPDKAESSRRNYGRVQKRIAELIHIRDQPTKSSVMALFDEYQSFATTGEGGKADSSFLNVARASGVFVVAATQSMQALYQSLGVIAANNIMNNMVSKVVFPTKDPDTQEYFIKLAGVGYRGHTYAPNFYATFDRLLRMRGDSKPSLPGIKLIDALVPRFTDGLRNQNPLAGRFQDIDVGTRMSTEVAKSDNEASNANEQHNRFVAKEDAIQREMQTGGDAPYINTTDMMQFTKGHALAFVSRAGLTKVDFVKLD